MKKKALLPAAWKAADTWILLFAWLFLSFFLYAELLDYVRIGPVFRVLLLLVIGLLCYLGGVLRVMRTGDPSFMRRLIFVFFVLYLYLLLSLTLLDATLRQGSDSIYGTVDNERQVYLSRFFNPIPLRSIYHVYLRGFVKGYVSFYNTAVNLVGNLCVLIPFSFFLPHFFPKQRRWYWFLLSILAIALFIELLQFLFMVGSCDVDDLILNTLGAFLGYGLLKLPPLRRLVKKATFGTAKKMPGKEA
ncbi:MAG: VanZ family protein [Clostridia bacterium]|nr:VanZ family protein [Clostridia bacterium]